MFQLADCRLFTRRFGRLWELCGVRWSYVFKGYDQQLFSLVSGSERPDRYFCVLARWPALDGDFIDRHHFVRFRRLFDAGSQAFAKFGMGQGEQVLRRQSRWLLEIARGRAHEIKHLVPGIGQDCRRSVAAQQLLLHQFAQANGFFRPMRGQRASHGGACEYAGDGKTRHVVRGILKSAIEARILVDRFEHAVKLAHAF